MIQNINALQKFKIYQSILDQLIQDEYIDYKYLFKSVIHINKKDRGFYFIVPTNFRFIFVEQQTYQFIELDPPMLFSDIPLQYFEQSENQRKEYFIIKQNTRSKYPDYTCLVSKDIWPFYVLESDKEEIKKIQQYLQKIPEIKRYPKPYQLQKQILQTNQDVSDNYSNDFIKKKIKLLNQDQFWSLQPSYKIPINLTQQTYSKNVDQLLTELMNHCKIYKLSPVDQPIYKENISLINDLALNNEWQENKYLRNRPSKTIKKEKEKENREKTQEDLLLQIYQQGFINIYEQQQINRELGKQYIKTFGLNMIDELIQQKVEQQGTILDPTFLQQLEQENDGLQIQTSSSQKQNFQNMTPIFKKQYQTNPDWERDRVQILQNLRSFNLDSKFQKVEIQDVIKADYSLSYRITSNTRKRLEESELQSFLSEARKCYSNVRRLLQYVYEAAKNKNNQQQLKENEQILKDEIQPIRNKIRQLEQVQTERDKFKALMYADLQKQLERAINEVINI